MTTGPSVPSRVEGIGAMNLGPIRFTWQNLDEDGRGQVRSRFLHGRAWLRVGRWEALRWEWCLGRTANHCSLGALLCSHEVLVSVHAGLPWIAVLYLTIPRSWKSKPWLPVCPEGWDLGGSIHGGAVWIDLLSQRWASISSRDPFWKRRQIHIEPMRLIFGSHIFKEVELEMSLGVPIPMPEGCYTGKATRKRATWTRKRWPWWPLKIVRSEWWIEVEGGIPHPGKGENSWDCGEDATMAAGSSSEQLEGAIAHFVEVVLRDRRRYGGGGGWVPEGAKMVFAPQRKRKP